MSFFSYVKARAAEPSTLAGLALVVAGLNQALQQGATKSAFYSASVQVALGFLATLKSDPVRVAPGATVVAVAP